LGRNARGIEYDVIAENVIELMAAAFIAFLALRRYGFQPPW
jgi:hypothetical protein